MTAAQKTKVSDIIAETLERLEIRHAFGIIGAGNVHLFESIANRGYTEIICVHHEQAATMAMQTYYRTCGKIAACLLTTGAGSTNGVTGVVSAWADSIPGLVIAGNENSKFTDPDSPYRMWGVQGYDSVDMVRNVTKYANRVTDPTQIISELEKAKYISLNDRPGPVWIEVPMNIQSTLIDPSTCDHFCGGTVLTIPSSVFDQTRKIVNSLKTAKRPVLWLGHGIRLSNAIDDAEHLVNLLKIPVLVSWAGIDMFDASNPYVYGRAGVYGQRCANFVLQNSDYVLAIGTRLAIPQVGYDLTELARAAKIDVVDIDIVEAMKHQPRVSETVECDAGMFMNLLSGNLRAAEYEPRTREWINQCNQYRKKYPTVDKEHADKDGFINSYPFMETLNQHFKPNQIVVTDMGTALLSGHQVLEFKKGQRLMTSTGLGEMGFGLPGAIGASFATDRGEVMCLNCDGGMMLNLQELQTIVHHKLPIKIFVFNNDGYLMIKHTQNALFKGHQVAVDKATGVSCPNFSKIATAFDIPSYKIYTWDDADVIIPLVQSTRGPVICEVFMHPKQLFSPKLGLSVQADGTMVSSPLEDLSPLIPRKDLEEAMIVGMHEKSKHG